MCPDMRRSEEKMLAGEIKSLKTERLAARCYPVALKLENQVCLVVGGGAVAERKVSSLLKSGAKVKLVSKEVTPRLRRLIAAGLVAYRQGEYACADLAGVFLAIGATSCPETNRRLAQDCRERNLLVNVVDSPELCNFYVPAVVTRDSFQIAVSTGGKSPLLARKIREELAKRYGPEYGELAGLLGRIREKARREIKDLRARQALFGRLLDGEVLELMQKGLWKEAKERVLNNAGTCCGGQSPDGAG